MSARTEFLYYVVEHRLFSNIRHGPFKWRRLAEEFAVRIAGHRPITIEVEIEERLSPDTTTSNWRRPA